MGSMVLGWMFEFFMSNQCINQLREFESIVTQSSVVLGKIDSQPFKGLYRAGF